MHPPNFLSFLIPAGGALNACRRSGVFNNSSLGGHLEVSWTPVINLWYSFKKRSEQDTGLLCTGPRTPQSGDMWAPSLLVVTPGQRPLQPALPVCGHQGAVLASGRLFLSLALPTPTPVSLPTPDRLFALFSFIHCLCSVVSLNHLSHHSSLLFAS